MFATFITLAVIAFAIAGLRDLARQDGAKIVAALQGRSWISEPGSSRPLIVRFSSSYRVAEPAQPMLRAAA